MDTTDLLLLLGAGFLLFAFVPGLNGGGGSVNNTITAVFSSINLTNISNWQLVFMIQNTSNNAVTFNSLSGTLSTNGSTIGNISSFTQMTIPANSQLPLTLNFTPSILNLPGAVASAIQQATGGNSIALTVTGNMNFNNLVLPFSLSQNVTI